MDGLQSPLTTRLGQTKLARLAHVRSNSGNVQPQPFLSPAAIRIHLIYCDTPYTNSPSCTFMLYSTLGTRPHRRDVRGGVDRLHQHPTSTRLTNHHVIQSPFSITNISLDPVEWLIAYARTC